MVEQVSIRINREAYNDLLAISGRLSNREKRRVSLADTVAAIIEKYPKPKKARK